MPKGYWIAHVTVTNPEQYAIYAEATALPFKMYGANVLARGGKYTALEGEDRSRNVVIEFESYQKALDCYNSPEYQNARNNRVGAGIAQITIVEGPRASVILCTYLSGTLLRLLRFFLGFLIIPLFGLQSQRNAV